ncbi:hypothetical protein PGT21_020352 [Puccinia graminis f. sp. tritici]|uniref:Uncharacterized protein n=1 Tax=Puccinia graminis f. sp. tritici TaxID=56615 RepID=A0A5B0S241_PUCGR|nr:hypothetical protein PGT21_020352 [Puccinia graminis f. sp. tritici]KAA1131882.1 hypothetical protein PGTUg99_032100 [Puccinia graminis f. sp. tritici]
MYASMYCSTALGQPPCVANGDQFWTWSGSPEAPTCSNKLLSHQSHSNNSACEPECVLEEGVTQVLHGTWKP